MRVLFDVSGVVLQEGAGVLDSQAAIIPEPSEGFQGRAFFF